MQASQDSDGGLPPSRPSAGRTGDTGAEGLTPGTGGYRRLMLALFMAGVAAFAQLYSPQGMLPLISADLGIDSSQAALTISAATLGLALAVIPWSWAGDRFGRRPAMIASLAGAVVFGVAGTLMPSFELLVAFRALEGASLGAVPALALALLGEEVAPRAVPVAAGIYIAGNTVGGLSGRILAAPVGEALHWQAGMVAVLVLSAACTAGFALLSPRARRFVPVPVRPGAALAALAGSLRSPVLLVLYAQAFLLMGGFVSLYNFMGYHLMEEPFGLPVTVVSLLFLAYLAGTWSSPTAGRLAARFGRRPVLLACGCVQGVGALLTLVPWLPAVVLGLLLFTAGFFGVHSVASGWSGAAATHGKAQATALYTFAYYAGSSVLGWLSGIALDLGGWTATVLFVTAAVVVALALALTLPGPQARPTGGLARDAGDRP